MENTGGFTILLVRLRGLFDSSSLPSLFSDLEMQQTKEWFEHILEMSSWKNLASFVTSSLHHPLRFSTVACDDHISRIMSPQLKIERLLGFIDISFEAHLVNCIQLVMPCPELALMPYISQIFCQCWSIPGSSQPPGAG